MRKAFRLTGLFALVLGAMAFSATAAQAELNAHWNINGANITNGEGKTLEAGIAAAIEGSFGALLTKSGNTTVEILCTTIGLKGAALKALGGATGKIHFEGCITKLKGSTAAVCKPHSPGAAEGLIETNPLDGLIKLHLTSKLIMKEKQTKKNYSKKSTCSNCYLRKQANPS